MKISYEIFKNVNKIKGVTIESNSDPLCTSLLWILPTMGTTANRLNLHSEKVDIIIRTGQDGSRLTLTDPELAPIVHRFTVVGPLSHGIDSACPKEGRDVENIRGLPQAQRSDHTRPIPDATRGRPN